MKQEEFEDFREAIADGGRDAIRQLIKVSKQVIDLEKLDVEKAKTAAAAKRLAVEDAYTILNRIKKEETEEDVKDTGEEREENEEAYTSSVSKFIK